MKVKVWGVGAALVFYCSVLSAQRVHYVLLDTKPITLPDRSFYIVDVVDARVDTTTIGIVYVGPFKAFHRASMPKSCAWYLTRFFRKSLPETGDELPVTIKIEKFRVEERVLSAVQSGWVDMTLDFIYNGKLIYQSVQHQASTGRDVTKQHAELIKTALENALIEFNENGWMGSARTDASGSIIPELEAALRIERRYFADQNQRAKQRCKPSPCHLLPLSFCFFALSSSSIFFRKTFVLSSVIRYENSIRMSQAFMREREEEWLGNIDPTLTALERYLTRDSGMKVFEVKRYTHPELKKEVYEMSNGLSYALDDDRRWYVL